MVSSGIVAIKENRAERWAIAVEHLLSGSIRNVSTDYATCEKIRLPAFNYRPLHHSVHISSNSSLSNHLAIGASLCVARIDTGAYVDMQMEFGGAICEPNKLRST